VSDQHEEKGDGENRLNAGTPRHLLIAYPRSLRTD
jgi:hypothetical protein